MLRRALLCQHTRRRFSTLVGATTQDGNTLQLSWVNGDKTTFHNEWLWDHCPKSFHPQTGQHLNELRLCPANVVPMDVGIGKSGETLRLSWSGSHTSVFDAGWLWSCRYDRHVRIASVRHSAVQLWRHSDLQDDVPCVSWAAMDGATDAAARSTLKCLRKLRRFGFCKITGMPTTVDATAELASKLGRIQGSFYGEGVCDLTPQEDVKDTAWTDMPLPLHTDTTYFAQPIGLQLFVCKEQPPPRPGRPFDGASRLADGYMLAQVLRKTHPETYDYFCRIQLRFQHVEGDVDMRVAAPVFNLDPGTGEVVCIRFNETDRATLDYLSFEDTRAFYSHVRVLNSALDELELSVRMESGDAIIQDNHRTLHGRHGFEGRRSLLATWMTVDDWQSRLRYLESRFS